MNAPYIPAATVEKLNGFHPEGTRHQAKIDIAIPLIGNGISPEATLLELNRRFPNGTAKEHADIIRWVEKMNPSPSGYGQRVHTGALRTRFQDKTDIEQPIATIPQLSEGFSCPIEEWLRMSAVPIPKDPREHAALLISTLYAETDYLNGVWKHGVKPDGKVFPDGEGVTRSRKVWLDRIAEKGTPFSEAGCWWRMNPVKAKGSGFNGAPTDADVTDFRFALVEHDKVDLNDQLAVLARFWKYGLPIAAVILTGGKSVHAWVQIGAKSDPEYREQIGKLLSITEALGFDANKNPSRLARIPGVQRQLGAVGEGWQRLIFLDPEPLPFEFEKFKNKFPVQGLISGKDLKERIKEWMKPRKADFTLDFLMGRTPDDGFYFRPGEVTVWSGVTGHGKSSLLAQFITELLAHHRCFIASMEHRPEQLCELLTRITQGRSPTSVEAEKFVETYGDRFYFADLVGEIRQSELFRLMDAAHRKSNVTHFFIDSLMRVADLEEDYPAQLAFVNELQSFAKRTGGHIHLVAHPRKIDETSRVKKMDLKGSSAIPNNADNVLCIRRNVQKQDADENGKSKAGNWDAEIVIEKQRATGWQGAVKLAFDPSSRRFTKYHSKEVEHRSWHD